MRTSREKYMNDPEYHALVQTLESFIERAQFTPLEVREAAMLACVRCEMRRVRPWNTNDPAALSALDTLEKFLKGQPS